MSGAERFRHLGENRQELFQAQRISQCRECFAFNQLHRDEVHAFRFTDLIDRDEVRMIQRRQRASFTLKASQSIDACDCALSRLNTSSRNTALSFDAATTNPSLCSGGCSRACSSNASTCFQS